MNVKGISVVVGALCLGAGACNAAQTVSHGVIQFRGSIVEAPCAANARSSSVMELTACPTASRDRRVDVRQVATVAGANAASAQLVSETRNGRYYDQRYLLVDNLGKPIQSGAYVITLTSP